MVESGDSLENRNEGLAPAFGRDKKDSWWTMSPGIEALRISDRPNADPTVLVDVP